MLPIDNFEELEMTFATVYIPLTQASMSHSTNEGAAPRRDNGSAWVLPHSSPPAAVSMRCDASIRRTDKTKVYTFENEICKSKIYQILNSL